MALSGTTLFVSSMVSGKIGAYGLDGTVINASLISGLNQPFGVAVSGANLLVANYSEGNGSTISEYTTTGTLVNASFLKGVSMAPSGIAVSGSDVYVASLSDFIGFGSIGEYTTTGTVVNGSLVGGLGAPHGIAVVVPDQPTDTPAMPLWGLAALGMLLVGAAVRLMRAPIRR
jgi:hypothetical protein